MESPNTEFRAGFEPKLDREQQLSDQYRSMRDLLKVYGLSVSEDNSNNTHPHKGKRLRTILSGYIPR